MRGIYKIYTVHSQNMINRRNMYLKNRKYVYCLRNEI